MNWRNSPTNNQGDYQDGEDHFYTYPNTALFPDFAGQGTGWFDYLQNEGLRTYFNDHPYPANNGSAFQTTPAEVAFRWAGLSAWMARGLTYWWCVPVSRCCCERRYGSGALIHGLLRLQV